LLNFVPVVCIIGTGISFAWYGYTLLRAQAAGKLVERMAMSRR
jgi:hypothetical protein